MVGDIEEAVPDSEQVPGDDSTASSSHAAKEDFEIKIEKPWIKSFDDAVHGYSSIFQVHNPNDFPTIFKVPDFIRNHDPRAYDPVIVSLGPYHHRYAWGYADCSPPLIDKLKFYYLRKFLKRNPNHSFSDYIKMIKDMEMKVRSAYSEPLMMSSDYFVRMMLLDCCFVLEVITSIFLVLPAEGEGTAVDDDTEAELVLNPIMSTAASRLQLIRDMLLLENQLPLFLLEHLFACIRNVHYWDGNFSSLMLLIFGDMMPSWSLNTGFSGGGYHFLHLFHSSITSLVASRSKNNGPAPTSKNCTPDQPWWGPSATQLRDAGVHFEKEKDAGKNFLFVNFERGRMKMTPLLVDDHTNTLFRNLIAFEQCYAKSVKTSKQLHHMGVEDQYFTAYASLMDDLINVDADVSLLQGKGIIINWLGSDEEVALLFNNLVKGTLVWVDNGYLSTVSRSLNKHWDNKWNKLKAKLNRDYLSSPWAKISLFGAVALFILTAMQTTYTVLSYY